MQSDALNRARWVRARRRVLGGSIAILAGLVLIALSVVLLLFNVFDQAPALVVGACVVGILLLLPGIFNLARGLAMPTSDPLGARLAQVLSAVLDNRHALVRDVSLSGVELDALVVGPGGVVAFKLVDAPGIFRCEGDYWLSRAPGKDFLLWERNPTRELLQELDHLRAYMAKQNLHAVPISALIVFTDPRAEVSARTPAVPVTTLSTLAGEIRHGYLLGRPVEPGLLKRARRALVRRR